MDLVTQCVLGASAGQVFLGRRLPRSAWLAGLLGGYVPDADVFIRPAGDAMGGLLWHRHFSHGIGFMPIGALLAVLPFLLFPAGRRVFGWLYLAALAGIATHGPLDACTSYGTCLWWPLNEQRVSWDLVGIIDPLVTLPLAVTVAWSVVRSWRAARVAGAAPGEAAAPNGVRRGTWMAMAGLVWAWAYIVVGGGVMHARALSVVETLARSRGHTVGDRVRVMPQPLTLFLWRSVYEHQGRVWSDAVHVLPPRTRVIAGSSLPLETVDSAVARAPQATDRVRRAVEGFFWFSDGWVSVDPTEPLFLGDMRYGVDPERFSAMWGVRLPAADDGRSPLFGGSTDRRARVGLLWDQLVLKDPRWTSTPR